MICSNVPDVPELEFVDNCSDTSDIIVEFEETTYFTGTEEEYQLTWTWTATDSCGNVQTIVETINVITEDFITEVDDSVCIDDGLVDLFDYLPADADTSIEWVVISGDTTIEDGILNPLELELGDYVFSYSITNNGCLDTILLTINVNDKCIVRPCGAEDLKISKAVTPNGDNFNDFFTVGGVEECGFIIDLKMFNRFGDIVYESRDYQNNWSGESPSGSIGGANRLPNGTYYYVIEFKNSGLKSIAGPIYFGTN